MRAKNLIVPVAAIILIATGVWTLQNWQTVYDGYKAANFQPSREVEQLTLDTTMNDSARRTFYATRPTINGSANFKQICRHQHDKGAVLGCYTGDQIYIYDVDNPELKGIKQVTAAHEMLHAAYARLSDSQRREINSELSKKAQQLRADSQFSDRMKVYQDLSESARLDELHSIIGTEYKQIGTQLEKHYGSYFDDRQRVVAMYQDYATVFSNLSADADKLAMSLDSQAIEINRLKLVYQQANQSFSADVSLFNQRSESGYFTSQAEFNNQRQELVQRSVWLDNQRIIINQAIDKYNKDKQRYEGLTAHLTELNNSIDSSSIDPVPKV